MTTREHTRPGLHAEIGDTAFWLAGLLHELPDPVRMSGRKGNAVGDGIPAVEALASAFQPPGGGGNHPPPSKLAADLAAATARADEAERREREAATRAAARTADWTAAVRALDEARAALAAAEARERAMRAETTLQAEVVAPLVDACLCLPARPHPDERCVVEVRGRHVIALRRALGRAAPTPPPGPCARPECVAIREAVLKVATDSGESYADEGALSRLYRQVNGLANVVPDRWRERTVEIANIAYDAAEALRSALAQPAPSHAPPDCKACRAGVCRVHGPEDERCAEFILRADGEIPDGECASDGHYLCREACGRVEMFNPTCDDFVPLSPPPPGYPTCAGNGHPTCDNCGNRAPAAAAETGREPCGECTQPVCMALGGDPCSRVQPAPSPGAAEAGSGEETTDGR